MSTKQKETLSFLNFENMKSFVWNIYLISIHKSNINTMKTFFKINLYLLFLLSASIVNYSCTNESERNEVVESIPDKDKQLLSSIGFKTEGLIDMGTYYVVEGDIMLEKRHLSEYNTIYRESSGLKQVRYSELISRSNQRSITIGVSNSLKVQGKDNWLIEIQQAIAEWNSITTCNIHLTYTTSLSPDILISDDGGTLADNWLAVGSYPRGGKPGPRIKINLDFWNNYTLTSSQKKYNMVHEIGHCIGFMHTNWSGLGESSGTVVPGTPNEGKNPDPNSVMNGGTPSYSWNGFSEYDIKAAERIYPALLLEFVGFPYYLSGNQIGKDVSISVKCLDNISQANLNYEWFVNAGTLKSGQGTQTIIVAPLSPVSFFVRVKVKDISRGKDSTIEQFTQFSGY